MSMDKRINVASAMYGCHSDLDKYKTGPRPECSFEFRADELACNQCKKQNSEGQK